MSAEVLCCGLGLCGGLVVLAGLAIVPALVVSGCLSDAKRRQELLAALAEQAEGTTDE